MRLICPNCGAQYEVSDDVIPVSGRDVQCSNCGHTWFEEPGASVMAEAEESSLAERVIRPRPAPKPMGRPPVPPPVDADRPATQDLAVMPPDMAERTAETQPVVEPDDEPATFADVPQAESAPPPSLRVPKRTI
jgi:predicted Zn finger-like uncharacterized protein